MKPIFYVIIVFYWLVMSFSSCRSSHSVQEEFSIMRTDTVRLVRTDTVHVVHEVVHTDTLRLRDSVEVREVIRERTDTSGRIIERIVERDRNAFKSSDHSSLTNEALAAMLARYESECSASQLDSLATHMEKDVHRTQRIFGWRLLLAAALVAIVLLMLANFRSKIMKH